MNLKKSIESVVLACTLLLVSAASQAAFVKVDITADFDGGGTAVAKLLYNDLDVVGGVVTSFHAASRVIVFGQEISLSNAFDTPTLTLSGGTNTDGTVEHTSFEVTFVDMSPVDILEPGLESFSFYGDLTFLVSGSKGTEYSGYVVPLPASAWLFVSGLLGLVGMQRRRKV